MKANNNGCVILFVVIFVILAICLVPICSIWSLNTLFNLNIEYSFPNLAAALYLSSVISGAKYKKSD